MPTTNFPEHLLDILPAPMEHKVRAIEANGNHAELLARAAVFLEQAGFHDRFVTHGVRPEHIRPQLTVAQLSNPVAAVAEARQRLADLDAYTARLDVSVEAGELLPIWRGVSATDARLANLSWQRVEEELIEHARVGGIVIERRSDMHPAALLQVENA